MQYVSMAIVGLIVGAIAKVVLGHFMPDLGHIGWIKTILLGIGGSYVAGIIGGMIHKPADGNVVHPAGFLYSIVGAVALIFIAHAIHFV